MQASDERSGKPGWRILIAGTGGQGVLTAARLLCDAFVGLGHDVVSGQLHGMAQRGGAVQASVIIDGGISPVIARGRADFVIGFEPVETARAIPLMSERTKVYMNTVPVVPFVIAQETVRSKKQVDYPDVAGLIQSVRAASAHVLALDATKCAVESGAIQALNMVMLGCLLGGGRMPCTAETFWNSIEGKVPPALREINDKAFWKGAAAIRELQVTA